MTIIVDASVAIKWFVEETLHDEARHLFKYQREIQAPDFILVEVANVAWKKAVRKEISNEQARTIVDMIPEYIPLLIPSLKLLRRATELAIELTHPVYDCLYLACVGEENDVVVTADKRFFNKVRDGRIGGQIYFLDDPDLSLPLYIPLHKIDEIVKLSNVLEQTHKHLFSTLTEGKEFAIYNTAELQPVFDSPAYHRLHSVIETLDEMEQADVLALGWLGRGYDGTDWAAIRSRAAITIKSNDTRFLRYVGGMTIYLEDGLASLRKWT